MPDLVSGAEMSETTHLPPARARVRPTTGDGGFFAATSNRSEVEDISVLLKGNRLQIQANVDAEGIVRLKQILSKYEQILALL